VAAYHTQHHQFALTRSKTRNRILELLSKDFRAEILPSSKETHYFYDTFDWLLYQEGLFLYKINQTYVIANINNKKILHKISLKQDAVTKFWWDFPPSAFQSLLKKVIDVRALLALFRWDIQSTPGFLLNNDEKRVIRISFNKTYLNQGKKKVQFRNSLSLQSIRGYGQDLQRALDAVHGFSVKAEPGSDFLQALSQLNFRPGKYSSKITIRLKKTETSREAARKILNQFLRIMRQNEKGIIDDIDTEFLHDYRVAIRRTRSFLSQAKGIFPHEKTRYFRQKLGEMQRKTNRLRDLDVYLLNRENYLAVLPDSLKKGVEPLFAALKKEREQELNKVRENLGDMDTRQLLKEWEQFLKTTEMPETPNSHGAIHPFSRKIIKNRLRRVLKKGNKLLDHEPEDEALHSLRIDCKKLRYLLEFFSSLYDANGINILVKQLKSLQNLLGDYNDLSVQISDLSGRLKNLSKVSENSIEQAAAFGGLLTFFKQKKTELRNNFSQVFREFSDVSHLNIYDQLFS
jgi:CHAD domain-containing protein